MKPTAVFIKQSFLRLVKVLMKSSELTGVLLRYISCNNGELMRQSVSILILSVFIAYNKGIWKLHVL